MMPLPAQNDDSDLTQQPIRIANYHDCADEDRTFFGLYHNLQQVKRGPGCCTKDFRTGNMFAMIPCDFSEPVDQECPCICDTPDPDAPQPEVKRGIRGYSLMYLKDRFRFVAETFFGWKTPLMEDPIFYQGMWYAPVVDRLTGEIYLLVLVNYFDSEQGCDIIHSKCVDSGIAFDLFRLPGRPLAPIYSPMILTDSHFGTGV